jgi:hypothetical protein
VDRETASTSRMTGGKEQGAQDDSYRLFTEPGTVPSRINNAHISSACVTMVPRYNEGVIVNRTNAYF